MEYLLFWVFIGLIGLLFILHKKQDKVKPIDQKTNFQRQPVQHLPVIKEDKKDTYLDKKNNFIDKEFLSLEEQIGVDHCDGFQCNPNDECSNAEIVFCHKILKNTGIPSNRIFGQYPVRISAKNSGICRIDFAIKTPDGRALAIELDGYDAHVKMGRKKFDEQQQRQNALVAAGWTVLRFTGDNMTRVADVGYCINFIKRAYTTSERTDSLLTSSIIFADYNTKEAKNASQGKALFSTIRDKSYTICTSANDFPDDQKSQMTFWIRCFNHKCEGKAIRVRNPGPYGFFWYCDDCEAKYREIKDNGIPVG